MICVELVEPVDILHDCDFGFLENCVLRPGGDCLNDVTLLDGALAIATDSEHSQDRDALHRSALLCARNLLAGAVDRSSVRLDEEAERRVVGDVQRLQKQRVIRQRRGQRQLLQNESRLGGIGREVNCIRDWVLEDPSASRSWK